MLESFLKLVIIFSGCEELIVIEFGFIIFEFDYHDPAVMEVILNYWNY